MNFLQLRTIILVTSLSSAFGRIALSSYKGCFDYFNSPNDLKGLNEVTRIGSYSVNYAFVDSNNMTLEFCTSLCSLGGFRYFGVEESTKCRCGRSIGGLVLSGNDGECSDKCPGHSAQKCGRNDRISAFELIYPENGTFFIADRNGPTVTSANPSALSWTEAVRSDLDCVIRCRRSDNCQAVIFAEPSQTCHLLAFVYPPESLNGIDGVKFERG